MGRADFEITDSKLGRRTSTIHVSLTQGDQTPCVVGYITQSNLHTEIGISLPTAYSLSPPPLSLPSTQALRSGTDPDWSLHHKPFQNFRKAGQHGTCFRFYCFLPRKGQVGPALVDQWLCLEGPERFTQESLGYVADMFPQIMETAYGQEDLEREMKKLQTDACDSPRDGESCTPASSRKIPKQSQWARFWYPTVVLNIDIKKALPLEGAEWLFTRVRAKMIRSGRMDLEVVILDEGGDIVAVSSHIALIVGAERNMSRGNDSSKGEHGSKL